jgi:hypothetical protein
MAPPDTARAPAGAWGSGTKESRLVGPAFPKAADTQAQELTVHLHPPARKSGIPYSGRYGVSLDGEMIVENSRDPECDLARALLARGITGTVTIVDGATGKPRTIINIEKAARLRTIETGACPRFRAVETCAESPPAGETASLGITPKEAA